MILCKCSGCAQSGGPRSLAITGHGGCQPGRNEEPVKSAHAQSSGELTPSQRSLRPELAGLERLFQCRTHDKRFPLQQANEDATSVGTPVR